MSATRLGEALPGNKLVRFAFIDEGGVSKHERFAVVAAVIVHADNQLIPLEEEIRSLIEIHVPEQSGKPFCFHAKDIWSGTRFYKDRDRWPLIKRLDILYDLSMILRRNRLPVVYSAIDKSVLPGMRSEDPASESQNFYSFAFATCVLQIEGLFRDWIGHNEVVQLVAEDNPPFRSFVRGIHENFRYPSLDSGIRDRLHFLPLSKIRGSIHFAEKRESVCLQMADFCAFAIRGYKMQNKKIPSFLFDSIKKSIVPQKSQLFRNQIALTVSPPYQERVFAWRKEF